MKVSHQLLYDSLKLRRLVYWWKFTGEVDRLKILCLTSFIDIRNNDGEKSSRDLFVGKFTFVQKSRSHCVPANWTRESARIGCSVWHGSRTPSLSFPFLLSNTCICVEHVRIDISRIRVIVLHLVGFFARSGSRSSSKSRDEIAPRWFSGVSNYPINMLETYFLSSWKSIYYRLECEN